ncbi:MAG TPA: transporter [Armatimonadota bacterium]|jgi:hypothetical protein
MRWLSRFRLPPALCLLPLVWSAAAAQEAPAEFQMQPDRPTVVTGPFVIPWRHSQIEAGVYAAGYRHDPLNTSTVAVPVLLRIGMPGPNELRVDTTGYQLTGSSAGDTSGLGDAELGWKHQFTQQQGHRPALGLLGQVTLPTGSGGYGSRSPSYRAAGLLSLALSQRTTFQANLGLGSVVDVGPSPRYFQVLAAATVAQQLTPKASLYWELYYYSKPSTDRSNFLSSDFGVAYQLAPRVVLDLGADIGLSHSAANRAVQAGVSWYL